MFDTFPWEQKGRDYAITTSIWNPTSLKRKRTTLRLNWTSLLCIFQKTAKSRTELRRQREAEVVNIVIYWPLSLVYHPIIWFTGSLSYAPIFLLYVGYTHFKIYYLAVNNTSDWKVDFHVAFKVSWPLVMNSGRYISNTSDSVSSGEIQTLEKSSKIQRVADYFWLNSRCLHSQWNTVSSV